MLKGMRKSAKQILWPLIIVLTIGMGGYGVWYLVRPEVATSKAGVIWGKEVTLEEFFQTARAARAVAALGGTELERKQIYTVAWQRILLTREAAKLGITATRQELATFLARWPIFQIGGKFNPERYQRVLNSLGLEEGVFEDQVQNILALDKMRMMIQNQALVSDAEISQTYQRLNEKIRVEYVQVAQDEFNSQTEITESELNDYYRQNMARFQVQTQVEIQYILIPRQRFEEDVQVTPEEIEARFQEKQASLAEETGPVPKLPDLEEEIRGELVYEKAQKGASALADTINHLLDEATSLEEPAKEYDLPVRDSGLFAADEAVPGLGDVPEINRQAFSMEKGEIVSYPVPVPDGFIFFQMTGSKGASVLSFDEARAKIGDILRRERARQEAITAARNALTEVRRLMTDEEYDFESAVEEQGMKTVTTPFFTRDGSDEIPAAAQFVQAAFLTVPGRVSELVPTEEGFDFLTVTDRKPAGPMPKDEKEKWETATRRYKATLVYDAWFNNLIRESKFSIINKDLAP